MENAETPAPVTTPFRQPKPVIRWLAFALAATGWLLSLMLLLSSAGTSPNATLLDAFCGGEDGGGCRSVLSSKYGYWQIAAESGGPKIPVSLLGMAYFAFVGLWYLFIGPPTRGRSAYHLLLLFIIVIGAYRSAYFIYIMGGVLHEWCYGCPATHVVNFGLLLLTLAAYPWTAPKQAFRPHPTGRLALATTTACLLAAFAHLAIMLMVIQNTLVGQYSSAYRKLVDDPTYVVWNHQQQPLVSQPIAEKPVLLGDENAPNTVVIFSDFECTRCRTAHKVLGEQVAKQAGKLRVIFRSFPQDPACNTHPDFQAGGHRVACKAARAFEAAHVLGDAETAHRMSSLLYERQEDLAEAPFADWAEELGLDPAVFRETMESDAVKAQITADVELGLELDITGVPVMYLNNRRLIGWSNPQTWDALLGENSTEP